MWINGNSGSWVVIVLAVFVFVSLGRIALLLQTQNSERVRSFGYEHRVGKSIERFGQRTLVPDPNLVPPERDVGNRDCTSVIRCPLVWGLHGQNHTAHVGVDVAKNVAH